MRRLRMGSLFRGGGSLKRRFRGAGSVEDQYDLIL